MKLPITIEYNNGEKATYIAQPPEWAKWEKETGKVIGQASSSIGIWDLMFLAHSAYKREAAGKPVKPFAVWMETISDIKAEENQDPKSTSPVASADS